MDKTLLTRLFQVAAAILVAALAVGLYKAKTDAAGAEQRVRALQTEISDTQAEMRALRAEIARAESPANIEALAKDRLGMVVGDRSAALPEAALDRQLPAPSVTPAQ